ncbi:MAG TPA: AIPR family protein [Candidatus Paceibacterota bacterium]|nr:AIPR family protein [Candidatus Paceibacterota bacterium]
MAKSTLLTFGLIKSEVEKYAKENVINDPSEAFLQFAMEKKLDIDRDEVVEATIDGSGDKGIDAIYIDEESDELRPIVYLIQAKYYRSEDKFDRSLEGDALLKMHHAIDNFILKSPKEIHSTNVFLLSKLRDIKALSNPRFEILFLSNSAQPNSDAKKEFEEFIKAQGHDFFRVEYVTLSDLAELITPATTRPINTKLKLSGAYFEWSFGEARVIVGRIHGRDLAELRRKEGGELFDRNVRGYLSRSNNVNKEILKTASDQIEGSRFFLLNNGVTIVCNNFTYLGVRESPEIEIAGVQIVNGGQTTNSIYEASQINELADSVYVLVKIIATDNPLLVERITESTNTQTNVRARDLRSNDIIQKTIERLLLNHGYYYESRKDKYKSNPAARGKRIDMEVAGQAYYAFRYKEPADTKNKKRQIFGALYNFIYHNDDPRLADDILLSFKALEWLRKSHSKYRDMYSFVKYAEFHSLTMLSECGVSSLDDLNIEKTETTYKKILDATALVVKEDLEKMDDTYSHRLLFIDPVTIGRIREAYLNNKQGRSK